MFDSLQPDTPSVSFDPFPFRRYALDALLVYVAIAGLLVAWANEAVQPAKPEPVAIVEPANGDQRWLQLQGVEDPYSDRGQAIIRQRAAHRDQLEKILARNDRDRDAEQPRT